jgi:hypothetical protein
MYRRKIFLWFVLCLLPIMTTAGTGPRIHLDQDRFDYGDVLYGDEVHAEFAVKNTGDQPLVIEKIRTTCGCTKAVSGSKTIPPGESTTISVAFDTKGLKSGKKRKRVFVHTNDPAQPVVEFPIEATVIKQIEVIPPALTEKLATPVSEVPFSVMVGNSSKSPVTITGLKMRTGEASAEIEPETVVVQPGKREKLQLTLHLPRGSQWAYCIGRLDLVTDHPTERFVRLRYFVQLAGD